MPNRRNPCADDGVEVVLLMPETRQLQAIPVVPSTGGPRGAVWKQHITDIILVMHMQVAGSKAGKMGCDSSLLGRHGENSKSREKGGIHSPS